MRIDVQKIELLLAQKGMSRIELASRSGVSRQNISTIITRGTCAPKTVGKLAAGLGVDVQEIAKL